VDIRNLALRERGGLGQNPVELRSTGQLVAAVPTQNSQHEASEERGLATGWSDFEMVVG
jgi:hypothetical protein